MRRKVTVVVCCAVLALAGGCAGESTQERENAPPVPGENATPTAEEEELETPATSGPADRNAPRSGSGPDPYPGNTQP